tara:strand:- start:183 stop:677 length:495 start_codon:yes stop_codon:yes gene_type:complete
MRLDLLHNIPDWETRLSSKLLEKKANMMNAALHGMGRGAKWGAGLGAAYGAGSAALSDDPNASVVKGALRGGLSGGITGGALGGVGGGLLGGAPKAMEGVRTAITPGPQPGLNALQNTQYRAAHWSAEPRVRLYQGGEFMDNARKQLIPGDMSQAPGWAQSLGF